jgi:hypothetical protein
MLGRIPSFDRGASLRIVWESMMYRKSKIPGTSPANSPGQRAARPLVNDYRRALVPTLLPSADVHS